MNPIRFRVLGFDVNVQSGFFLLAGVLLLFGLQAGNPLWAIAAWAGIIFLSILIHELGHALVARQCGLRVGEIYIHGFGGHVTHGRGKAVHGLWVSIAGPAAGLACGLTALFVAGAVDLGPAVEQMLSMAITINIGWSLFNLLPTLPLDGGNALASLLELFFGPMRGREYAGIVGMGVGGGLAVLALVNDLTWIMLIGGYCAYTSYQTWILFRGR